MSDLWDADKDKIHINDAAAVPVRRNHSRDHEWAQGYRAALADLKKLGFSRNILDLCWLQLIADMEQDSRVIEHEMENKTQKRRLAAAREASVDP